MKSFSYLLQCHHEDSSCVASVTTPKNNQTYSQTEGSLRLCCWIVKECRQYFNRIFAISIHICCDWRATV